jgi:cell fate (sporulation/competence/biofilm development) regulator YlbF (YheA/YmcA/DUF963 family)
MNDKILEKTYQVIDEIKDTIEYNRMVELNQIMKQDEDIQLLLISFNKIKVKYDEVAKYGKYHPDLKKVQLELAATKEKVFTNEIISEYKQLEKEMQKRLDYISSSIAKSVSSKIKHPNEIGLINKH